MRERVICYRNPTRPTRAKLTVINGWRFDRRQILDRLSRLFVTSIFAAPPISASVVVANPLSGADHQLAAWSHAHLTRTFATVLEAFSEPGSGEWIRGVLA